MPVKSLKNYATLHDQESTKRFVAFANLITENLLQILHELAQLLSDLTKKRVDSVCKDWCIKKHSTN